MASTSTRTGRNESCGGGGGGMAWQLLGDMMGLQEGVDIPYL